MGREAGGQTWTINNIRSHYGSSIRSGRGTVTLSGAHVVVRNEQGSAILTHRIDTLTGAHGYQQGRVKTQWRAFIDAQDIGSPLATGVYLTFATEDERDGFVQALRRRLL